MTLERLAEIKAMVEQITDVGWQWIKRQDDLWELTAPIDHHILWSCSSDILHEISPSIKFIAAAPDTIRELVAEVARLTVENNEFREDCWTAEIDEFHKPAAMTTKADYRKARGVLSSYIGDEIEADEDSDDGA